MESNIVTTPLKPDDVIVPENTPESLLEQFLNDDAPEYSNADIICMLQHIYEQNKQILEHVAGIERAFREVADTTTEAMGMLDGPLASMLGKLMGRGNGH